MLRGSVACSGSLEIYSMLMIVESQSSQVQDNHQQEAFQRVMVSVRSAHLPCWRHTLQLVHFRAAKATEGTGAIFNAHHAYEVASRRCGDTPDPYRDAWSGGRKAHSPPNSPNCLNQGRSPRPPMAPRFRSFASLPGLSPVVLEPKSG
jgi:hypothetical protein